MGEQETIKIVIVGHVDHGKSTLIGRLLYDTGSITQDRVEEIRGICSQLGKDFEFGFLLDNLEEERDQGITIDTTQIFFNSDKRQYVIIDAPGHVEFVKNMVTGASQAEAAAVIIDAEEGIREQTRRHAFILSMLGIQNIIVLVNKMDQVYYSQTVFEKVNDAFSCFLRGIRIQPLAAIPISARQGDNVVTQSGNIPWYHGPTFLETLDSLNIVRTNRDHPARFAVQDVYNFSKRIIAGKVLSGTLRTDDEILILPSGETTRIRSLEEYGKTPTAADTGKCIGVTTADKIFCDRGYILSDPADAPIVTSTFTANIFWLDKKSHARDQPLVFRCSTQECRASITEFRTVINSSSLEPVGEYCDQIRNREVAQVTIHTDRPVIVEPFSRTPELGRFVLVTDEVSAGGIVTGVLP